jgi:cyclophilin family peptidyl-prolyl cis-trans isomerase
MRRLPALTLTITVLAGGCGQRDAGTAAPSPTASIPNPSAPAAGANTNAEELLHQTFAEAVSEDSPGNQQAPPDKTMTGLSTGRLRSEVQASWAAIRFTDSAGRAIQYTAQFDTERGRFRVRLRPDLAPNHVRNFIALARAGYYNGLVFEHLIRQQGDDGPDSAVELVEGGCPLGTGEPGVGHLGYWLRPEFSETYKHEPGTFGAFHDDSPESAACRFYVTLTKAPAMDGNFTAFGEVVEGLDVVRTISGQPKVDGSVQPVNPVVIRQVTIEAAEVR